MYDYQNSTKSVVSIQNFEVPAGVPLNVAESKAELQGNGSGFIWDEYGHIVCFWLFFHLFPLFYS